MSRSVVFPTRFKQAARRSGLVLASILAVLDVGAGALGLAGLFFVPPIIGAIMIMLGLATLAAVALAWSRRPRMGWIAAALRLASSALGLPVFFISGLPTSAVISAAGDIVLAVFVVVLLGVGEEARR